ncbi:hypothetical protein R3Q16_31100 [Rhodococcus globerulus]|uniref:Uncharacterized protein n=1 Tax=Rhodococcus globerulus TaxID=33008 RepID=A0ABU4C3J5_RHOGO|nr:hypothetical protein [Rhodococcus globerulus]
MSANKFDTSIVPDTEHQPLTRDAVRAIVSEEIGKVCDLLGGRQLHPGHQNPRLKVSQSRLQVEALRVAVKEFRLKFHRLRLQVQECEANGTCDRTVAASFGEFGQNLDDLLLKCVGDWVDLFGRVDGEQVANAHETSPSVDDAGAHSVGEAESAGSASANPAGKVTDPAVSFRFDPALDMIVLSIDGEDDIYLPYTTAIAASRELSAELRIQAFTRRNRRTA